ncbi:MAG TPA: GspH/FimT family pseudopilin [Burkholderiaceae bacterium]|nr:GspH/FimT family pseudopilin [Burkholderiaceae bacterium]
MDARATSSFPARHRARGAAHGFTLIEALVVMTIAGILAAVAMPSFSAFMADQRARGVATDFVTALIAARSEAIKRNGNVTITAATVGGSANWGAGWVIAAADGTQINRQDVPAGKLTGSTTPANTNAIVFNGSGRMTIAGTLAVGLSGASSDAGVTPRCVTIDLGGRPQLNKGACS